MTNVTPAGGPGEIYEREMVPAIFGRWASDLVEAAGIREGGRVLDVACGTGAVTRVAAARVGRAGRVVGLDVNPTMLAAARSAVSDPTIEWLEGSGQAMPLSDASFDVVLCQQGLQFFPDRTAGLREMWRVLVPGGRLALSCWRSVEENPGAQAQERALARWVGCGQAASPPYSLGERETLRTLLEGAGFREVRIRAETRTARYRSVEHLVQMRIRAAPTMNGALADQGPEVIAAIVADVTEALRHYTDDEGVGIPMSSHIATATR